MTETKKLTVKNMVNNYLSRGCSYMDSFGLFLQLYVEGFISNYTWEKFKDIVSSIWFNEKTFMFEPLDNIAKEYIDSYYNY